jgi:hypothetical protein
MTKSTTIIPMQLKFLLWLQVANDCKIFEYEIIGLDTSIADSTFSFHHVLVLQLAIVWKHMKFEQAEKIPHR